MSPRYLGRVTPSRVSLSAERGLAYWPAKRPTRTTGRRMPCTSTRLICSSTLSRLEMTSELQSLQFSAQSPPCSRQRLPSSASATCCLSAALSHAASSPPPPPTPPCTPPPPPP